MALPVIPDTLRVAFNWNAGAQSAENVMHFGGSAGGAPDLAALLASNIVGNQTIMMSGSASCPTISITPLNGTAATTDYALTNWSGNAGATDWAPAVACVVSLRTALRGRSYRGRIFLPFISEGTITTGRFGAVAAAQCGAAWTQFVGNMAADGAPLLVASYLHATSEEVTSCFVNETAGTVRRRQSRLRV